MFSRKGHRCLNKRQFKFFQKFGRLIYYSEYINDKDEDFGNGRFLSFKEIRIKYHWYEE